MIKFENVAVSGWEAAIRGMRNSFNSWAHSDSEGDQIGPNDLDLMNKLAKASSSHGKFLRMINVTVDIIAPLYWWKQFDQYKVGTVTNSCSTMHTICSKEFTLSDFSHEHLSTSEQAEWGDHVGTYMLGTIVGYLNSNRKKFFETDDKKYWWNIIQILPSSYNQRRTVQLNYEVLANIYFDRRTHKLTEWHTFCNELIESLPYASELITFPPKENETTEPHATDIGTYKYLNNPCVNDCDQ